MDSVWWTIETKAKEDRNIYIQRYFLTTIFNYIVDGR